MSKRVLIIEDSKSVANTISLMIKEELGYHTTIGGSVKECAKLLLEFKGRFDVALLDLGLPDSNDGEIVDFVTKFNIPIVILTGSTLVEDKIKNKSKNIVDYVVKDGIYSFKYAISVIKRIINNEKAKVLLVDDSRTFLENTKELIERYRLTVFTATNGKEALNILKNNKDVKLILTDYYMPYMDGLELIRKVRKEYTKDELSIIVTSGVKDKNTASKFLKYGANDFLYKGFTSEELFVRINANIELLELFDELKNRANRDFLSKLFNRRYLFEYGNVLIKEAIHKNQKVFLALIDIDKFKSINDTYGHDIGDIVIKEVSDILQNHFNRGELVARLGGEEFCILFIDEDEKSIIDRLEILREEFQNKIFDIDKKKVNFTVSIGCSFKEDKDLDLMIKNSDELLYKAKEEGRNKVIYK